MKKEQEILEEKYPGAIGIKKEDKRLEKEYVEELNNNPRNEGRIV